MTLQHPPNVDACVNRQSIERYAQAAELKKGNANGTHTEPYLSLCRPSIGLTSQLGTQLTMERLGPRSNGLPIIMG